MGTTIEDLKEWFDRGLKDGATHMLVATDSFDYTDYPIYVFEGEDVRKRVEQYQDWNKMSKVMEIYSYKKTWEEQKPGRVWNLGLPVVWNLD